MLDAFFASAKDRPRGPVDPAEGAQRIFLLSIPSLSVCCGAGFAGGEPGTSFAGLFSVLYGEFVFAERGRESISMFYRMKYRDAIGRSIVAGLLMLPLLLICPPGVLGLDLTLAWDANEEPDLAGYRIFVRTEGDSYDYGQPAWEGAETTCTISGLPDNTNLYCVARAFDTANNESGDSNEVFYEGEADIAPTADAGPDRVVSEGEAVTLDGTNSSDEDGTLVSYAWVQTAGTSVSLSGAATSTPWFTSPFVDASGEALTFELTVEDDDGLTDTDTVIVNVSNVNQAPTANAGPDQNVGEGETVALDGSNSSDPDGIIASYAWVQTGGVSVSLSNASSARPDFTAPNVGTGGASLSFQLTVTDNEGLQSSDSCIVNVSWVNLAPTADAGPNQAVNEGALVALDGSGSSDPDDGIASYLWSQIAGTPVTLSSPTSPTPQFTAPLVAGSGVALRFRLTVTDRGGLSDTDTVIINVSDLNQAPSADAGADQAVTEGDPVFLSGAGSYDPDGAIASYAWRQSGGPSVSLSDPASEEPSFTAPSVGPSGATLTFELTVTDDEGLQSTDTCVVTVSWVDDVPPAPPAGFQVTGVE